jgi:hypothetical protein
MENGKIVVDSWIQKRCKICQRWLERKQKEFCSKCAYENDLKYYKEYYRKHPEKYVNQDSLKRKESNRKYYLKSKGMIKND